MGLSISNESVDSSIINSSTNALDNTTSEAGSSTSATSQSSDQPDQNDQNGSLQLSEVPGDNATVEINASGLLRGFVLFGVKGAKRLRGGRTRLAQIDIQTCRDDDSFFDEMAVQFKKLRGCMRYLFSIWTFGSCDTVVVNLTTSPEETCIYTLANPQMSSVPQREPQ